MIYCMSDIHGEEERFTKMLDFIQFSADDTLYILGDVIDREGDGINMIRTIMKTPNMQMLLGNHEDMCLKAMEPDGYEENKPIWFWNGGDVTYEGLNKLTEEERMEILIWMNSLPVSLHIQVNGKKYRLCHGWPAYKTEDIVWGRPTSGIPMLLDADEVAIIGHTPTICLGWDDDRSMFRIHKDERMPFIDIDCGCGHDVDRKQLACLRLDDMHEFYV